MKKTIAIILCYFTLLVSACTEENIVPVKVKESFFKKFPNITSVQWEQENDAEWEAEFELESTEYSVKFTKDGKWLETESKLGIDRLTEEIISIIDHKYPNYKIEEVELINSPTLQNAFEVKIELEEIELEILIDANGEIINETSDNNEED